MDTHIEDMRKKLRNQLDGEDPFRSVYEVGYALESEAFHMQNWP